MLVYLKFRKCIPRCCYSLYVHSPNVSFSRNKLDAYLRSSLDDFEKNKSSYLQKEVRQAI